MWCLINTIRLKILKMVLCVGIIAIIKSALKKVVTEIPANFSVQTLEK